MTRAFVAVRLPDTVLDAVAARVAGVSVPGRRTTREQWHVTLQFLGNHADVDAVAAALDGIAGPPGRARIGGAGAFPEARRGRVLWLGAAEGAALLTRLAAEVTERSARLGHEPDARPFRPHLTLARCKDPTDLRGVVAALGAGPVGPEFTVDAVTVFESRPRAGGVDYIARATVPLRGGPLPA